MSSNTAIVADKTDAATAAMLKRKPSGRKTYKPHVSTKIRWAMEDSVERSREAQRRMRMVLDRVEEARTIAETTADARMLAVLGRLDHDIAFLALGVAEMERILSGAIVGSSLDEKDKKYSSQ